jgi:hypothetical protein
MDKRGIEHQALLVGVIVVVILVLIAIFSNNKLYAMAKSTSDDVATRLHLKQADPTPPMTAPATPNRKGFVSIYNVMAGGNKVNTKAVDPAEQTTQASTNMMRLAEVDFDVVEVLPIVIYWDQYVSRSPDKQVPPQVRVRYCPESVDKWFQFARVKECVFQEYPRYCDGGVCSMNDKIMNISKLPGPGWYQIDIQPLDPLLYINSTTKLPIDSNNAVLKFKYGNPT